MIVNRFLLVAATAATTLAAPNPAKVQGREVREKRLCQELRAREQLVHVLLEL